MLSVNTGSQWVTGDYVPASEAFVNVSESILLSDYGGGLVWTSVGHAADGRMLQIGWLAGKAIRVQLLGYSC